MGKEKSVHLVLSAGGARCLSYIGALKVLQQHGVGVKSISCCSAGTIIGALYAFGVDLNAVEEFAVKKGLQGYKGTPSFGVLSKILSLAKYPFAQFKSTRMPQFFIDIMGSDPELSAAKIPFATVGVDIVNNRFVVFSDQTHPNMKVSEAISIATAVPVGFPPVRRDHRVIVDAAVSTASPVWLASEQADDCPILVLKPQSFEDFGFMRDIGAYLGELFRASSESRDWYMFQADPRVRVAEINYDDIRVDQFDLTPLQVKRLIYNGATAMNNLLPYLWSKPEKMLPITAFSADDAGEQRAADLISKYRAVLSQPRNQIFISYHKADRKWLDRMLLIMEPFKMRSGLQIWSDASIVYGDIDQSIESALRSTKVAVLFVTADYLADSKLWKQQLSYFVEAAQKRELELIWVLGADCDYHSTDLTQFKPANDPERPLKNLSDPDQDTELTQIAQKIQEALTA